MLHAYVKHFLKDFQSFNFGGVEFMNTTVISALLAIFFYFMILICYKVMGKREISQLSIFDFVMNLIIADIVAEGIVQEEYWLDSLVGLLVLVALQIIMAKLQLRNAKARIYIDGEPSLIIRNGLIDYEELTKLRIQLDELIMLLRQNNVTSIDDVQYALLETNGHISIYEKRLPTKTFPLPFIISGQIKPYAIKSAQVQEKWVMDELKKHNITNIEEIKYLFYDKNHFIVHTKSEMKKLRLN